MFRCTNMSNENKNILGFVILWDNWNIKSEEEDKLIFNFKNVI